VTTTDPFAQIRAIADATLYEGYVLYPYRASSTKNHARWQFGVLMPPDYAAADPSERSAAVTEVVLDAPRSARLQVRVRFLHAQRRAGGDVPDWDEATERTVDVEVAVADALAAPQTTVVGFAAESAVTDGVERSSLSLRVEVSVRISELPGPYGALLVRVGVANRTAGAGAADRETALRGALLAAHTLLAVAPGRFLSMTDPPEWASGYVARCRNDGTWPVLAGSDDVVLSSPIILADHPQIAPESPGDLYDATEIDEILTLRTMALTDAEKAEARATDPRAAAIIDRVDGLPPEHLDRLHGALRYLRQVTGEPEPAEPEKVPWWDPGADTSVSPETDAVLIDGVEVRRGSRVRLRPGLRRTDAQDLFLAGRTATVEAVFHDVDGQQHLGVTPDDDAELAEISRWHGRFLYFAPDEVEPL
jgi:hypothetical protein